MLFLIVLYYNVGPFTTWSMYSAEISTLCVILHKHLLNCFLKYIKKSKEWCLPQPFPGTKSTLQSEVLGRKASFDAESNDTLWGRDPPFHLIGNLQDPAGELSSLRGDLGHGRQLQWGKTRSLFQLAGELSSRRQKGTSLVVQWLRIHLPMQGTRVWSLVWELRGFPGGSDCKGSACNVGNLGSISGLGRSPGEGNCYPCQYSYLGELHGQRSEAGYSPWGHTESDMT